MLGTTWLWRGVGPLTLAGLLVTGVTVRGEDAPPLARQLTDLGRQALAQGHPAQARSFFLKALELDPNDANAQRGLKDRAVLRVALQDKDADKPADADKPVATPPVAEPPADNPPVDASAAPAAPPAATLERAKQLSEVYRQQLTDDIRTRLAEAKAQESRGAPEAALDILKLAQNVVRTNENVDELTRTALDRQIQAQYLSTLRAEERIVANRAESLRLAAAAEQQQRTLDSVTRNQATVKAMMTQFDSLMSQGVYNVLYNGGTGDITAAVAPFSDARILAQEARALVPNDPTPYAGMSVSMTAGFLAQELAFEQLKEYRFMLTMQDVARANVPFPDGKILEYPDAERWRALSERRIQRYGRAVDLLTRDPKTKAIIDKLDEPISMSFANETPLEEVLKYIKSATQGPNDNGIPIYVDPVGLQEAEKTMTSPITLDLEGVPLKTTLRLLLKQLGLTYTVKDGMLTITSDTSDDQPTEIRVYPVADLSIIPFSLMGGGGGGMGGMGGGMGGMGGGMGGMGGGMGGMGGGMGGMGGGMGGMGGMGMMSVPVQDPADAPGGFLEKKSN
jgi:tetratricopeptide (TPR) repeat protein